MSTAITYYQAKDILDTAIDQLKRAMAKKATSAHGRMLQNQEIAELQTLVDKWDRKVVELDPNINSAIQVAQMVPR